MRSGRFCRGVNIMVMLTLAMAMHGVSFGANGEAKAVPPVAPSNPSAVAIGISTITWKWAGNSKDETGFKIWSDPGPAAPTTLRTTLGAYMTRWPQGGLFPNTQHTFQVAAANAAGDSARTPPLTAWTLATTPLPPIVDNPGGGTLDLAIAPGDGNAPGTQYAIQCANTGQWVKADGALGAAAIWRTAPGWGTTTVTGLAGHTQYGFAVTARNGAGIAAGSGAISTHTTLPVVPDVAGRTRTQATAAINAAGLVVGTVTEQHHPAIAANIVISQAPPPGTAMRAGSPVSLVISLGPVSVPVPNLAGMNRSQANSAITAAGLVAGPVTKSSSGTVPKDDVISQTPAAGTQVVPGTSVALVISLGAARATVPAVTGLSRAEAEAAIREAGLAVGSVTEIYHASIVAGNVLYQDPAPGTGTLAGTVVDLVVSKGTRPMPVPDLNLLSAEAAQASITAAGLMLGTLDEESSDTVPAGQVMRQDPAAGTLVAPGFSVNLTVSSGPAPAGCIGGAEKGMLLLDRMRAILRGLGAAGMD